MTDDSPRDDGDAPDEALDELVEPSVELRTAQEREEAAASDDAAEDASGEATPDRRDGVVSDSRDGLDELVEPSGELRTVQEQEAAGDDAGGDGDE